MAATEAGREKLLRPPHEGQQRKSRRHPALAQLSGADPTKAVFAPGEHGLFILLHERNRGWPLSLAGSLENHAQRIERPCGARPIAYCIPGTAPADAGLSWAILDRSSGAEAALRRFSSPSVRQGFMQTQG
jgi:hypothetical protein